MYTTASIQEANLGRERLHTAQHWNAKPRDLASLACDDDWRVREAVAEHYNTPPAILREMADEETDLDVLIALASNPYLPTEAIPVLAMNEDPLVREAIAKYQRLRGADLEWFVAICDFFQHRQALDLFWEKNKSRDQL